MTAWISSVLAQRRRLRRVQSTLPILDLLGRYPDLLPTWEIEPIFHPLIVVVGDIPVK
jgi:hypothetical protein